MMSRALQRATACLPLAVQMPLVAKLPNQHLVQGIAVHTGSRVCKFTGLLDRQALAYILHDSTLTIEFISVPGFRDM
jgi:hypothetical protein